MNTPATTNPRPSDPQGSGVKGDVLIDVRNLSTWFQTSSGLFSRGKQEAVRAVDGVSFDIRRGEIFGLVGESGSGKTTLGRTILGLVQATSGEVLWKGHDLAKISQKEFRPLRRHLSMIFQDPNASMNPAMTISQGVGHPLRIHGLVSSRAEMRAAVVEMLERCGLAPGERFLDRYPEDISGGQKQRCVIARSLITKPEFVVADEPVASLDMSVRAKVLELMIDLKDDLGLTYLYITHDLASSRFVCDRMAIMYLGQMIEWGDAKKIYDDPQHPYTRALLDAIPLPDPTRRNRERALPSGEIPDAQNPPAGCRFHPRCPVALSSCGWEGRDLIDVMEQRWTTVSQDVFEAELGIFGDLAHAAASRTDLRLPGADSGQVRGLLDRVGEQLPPGLADSIESIEPDDDGNTVVRFGFGPEPDAQNVNGRIVSCHQHGVTRRPGGSHGGRVPTQG
ncbi:MAG: oligopeptide/dipeptide ABC transporter ATP-binding protein [Glaciecola sp.]|jgi:oligopeptide/dipeptide ABC transporter ATP-binding protein